jgi:hypothetical protein
MLEREDLKLLSGEKALTEGNDENFLNSAVLIDGYLYRSEQTKDLEMKLRLKNSAGKEIGACETTVNPEAVANAVDYVSQEIIKQLQFQQPTQSWDMVSEAKEFYRQGKLLKDHGRYPEAMSLLETTHALQPGNVYYTCELFENAWFVRFPKGPQENTESVGKPCYYSDMELAELASGLVRQIQAEYDRGTIPAKSVIERLAVPLGLTAYRYNYFVHPVSASSEQVRLINRSSRKIFVEIIRDAARDRLSYHRYRVVWLSSDDPDELIKNIRAAYIQEIMPTSLGGEQDDLMERLRLAYYTLCRPCHRYTIWHNYTDSLKYKAFDKLWVQYLEELSSMDDPVLRFVSLLALAENKKLNFSRKTPRQRELALVEAKAYFNRAVDAYYEGLNCPNEPISIRDRTVFREYVRIAMQQVYWWDPEIIDIIKRIFEPLVEDNDALNIAYWSLYDIHKDHSLLRHVIRDREATSEYVDLLERIVKVLNTRKDNYYVRRMLRRTNDDFVKIRKAYPDLVKPSSPKNVTTTMVLSKTDWPAGKPFEYLDAHVLGDKLFVAFNGRRTNSLAFAAIDLSQRKLLYRRNVGCKWGTFIVENASGEKLNGCITGIAVVGHKAYVSVRDVGLIEFDLTDSRIEPRMLTERDGLPSISLTSIVAVEGRLWVAYGDVTKDSGLVIFDPAKGSYETILCSSLKSDGVFNSGQTYVLSSMVYGPNKKLLFLVGERGYDVSFEYPLTEYWGLWEMDTETKKLKHLWQNAYMRHGLERIDVCGGDYWLNGAFILVKFDPVLERGAFVAGWSFILGRTKQMFEMMVDPFVTDKNLGQSEFGHRTLGSIAIRTGSVHGDKMWARQGLSQVIIIHKGKSLAQAEVIDNNILNGGPVLRFISTPYGLVAIGEGTVGLIGLTETEESE